MSQSEIEHSTLEIVLDRVDRVYRPGDQVRGRVAVAARHGWSHRGVTLNVVGAAQLLLSRGGMFDSGGAARTVELMRSSAEIAPAGKFPDGITEVPFAFHVNGKLLRESYHGVYVNVCYTITVECRRPPASVSGGSRGAAAALRRVWGDIATPPRPGDADRLRGRGRDRGSSRSRRRRGRGTYIVRGAIATPPRPGDADRPRETRPRLSW